MLAYIIIEIELNWIELSRVFEEISGPGGRGRRGAKGTQKKTKKIQGGGGEDHDWLTDWLTAAAFLSLGWADLSWIELNWLMKDESLTLIRFDMILLHSPSGSGSGSGPVKCEVWSVKCVWLWGGGGADCWGM